MYESSMSELECGSHIQLRYLELLRKHLNCLLNLDILQGSFRLCNCLSLRRLVSWINHLPPTRWSTFWKSNFKQQLGCKFDIMDNKSYFFVFWHMQFNMSWYIKFFGFTFLNILYFFKYSCTNILHRSSLYTFYLLSVLFCCCPNQQKSFIIQNHTPCMAYMCWMKTYLAYLIQLE